PRLHVPTPQGGGQVRPRVSELLAGRQPRRPQGHAADDPGMAGPTEERQEPDRSLGHARTDTEGMACLDGAPSSRVWLRLCERFGCGHVFGLLARETNVPLALMLVRMALRPISKTRSLWRLPFSSGFRADPLVPIASPSPSMRIALRRKLVPAELAGSGRDRTVVVMAAFGRERIDDPRQLVGERHRGQLELVLDGLALEQSVRPAAQGVVMPFAVAKGRARALNQQLA